MDAADRIPIDIGYEATGEAGESQAGQRMTVREDGGLVIDILTTAGGVLFTGWMDRQFVAYDQATGRELWSTGVTGVPNASPITYAVDGKQYVAIVTGHGNPLSSGVPDVIPETQLPSVNSSSVYVFALPE